MISIKIDGIADAVKTYAEEAARLKYTLRRIVQRLGNEGYTVCKSGFDNAIYDGTKDVTVGQARFVTANRLEIAVTGTTVAFIEFGTGSVWPDNHPAAAELGAIRGGYGHHLGRMNTWRYPAENGAGSYGIADQHSGYITTYGNPANMAMYSAGMRMRQRVLEIATMEFEHD